MRRLLADENFNGRILRALLRLIPDLDVVRVQDTVLCGASDGDVLRWAADSGRIVITHDVATMVRHARERLTSGQHMPGLIAVRADSPMGRVIEDVGIVVLASQAEELAGPYRASWRRSSPTSAPRPTSSGSS